MNETTLDLPPEIVRILQAMAEAGVVGGTVEEVAQYLITREIDDLLRSQCLKLGGEVAA